MSAVLERSYSDSTAGMELTTGDEISLEATRWLFLAGDMIDPHRKNDLPHLKDGGEELANFCLRRTNGYLPRCTFTPLEVWAEWLPLEYFPEGVRPLKLKGEPVKIDNPNGITLVGKPLFGFPHYPGELIVDAVGLSISEKRGIVEIESLRDVPFGDPQVDRLQSLFFSAPPPIEIRLLEERITKVAEAHGPDVRAVAADMLSSCEHFKRWALTEIDKCHIQLDTRVQHQHTYSYSPKIRMLMRQMEITPRQSRGEVFQDEIMKAVASSGVSASTLETIMAKQGELFATAMAEAIKNAVAASKSE
jgi:hypothetical protein